MNNIFYGYRTTLKDEKTSLLTVKSSRNKREDEKRHYGRESSLQSTGYFRNTQRPQTSRGDFARASQEKIRTKNKDILIKKRRPQSAIKVNPLFK